MQKHANSSTLPQAMHNPDKETGRQGDGERGRLAWRVSFDLTPSLPARGQSPVPLASPGLPGEAKESSSPRCGWLAEALLGLVVSGTAWGRGGLPPSMG